MEMDSNRRAYDCPAVATMEWHEMPLPGSPGYMSCSDQRVGVGISEPHSDRFCMTRWGKLVLDLPLSKQPQHNLQHHPFNSTLLTPSCPFYVLPVSQCCASSHAGILRHPSRAAALLQTMALVLGVPLARTHKIRARTLWSTRSTQVQHRHQSAKTTPARNKAVAGSNSRASRLPTRRILAKVRKALSPRSSTRARQAKARSPKKSSSTIARWYA